MSTESLYFNWIQHALFVFGEQTSTVYNYVQTFKGPKTDIVIQTLLGDDLDLDGIRLVSTSHTPYVPPNFYVTSGNTNTIATGNGSREVLTLWFYDNPDNYKNIKKIRDALLKTEIERLMYPLPELNY